MLRYTSDTLHQDGEHDTLGQQVRGHVVSDVTVASDDVITRPTFIKTQQNVTVMVGQLATLRCRVDNLADRIVSLPV